MTRGLDSEQPGQWVMGYVDLESTILVIRGEPNVICREMSSGVSLTMS